MYRLLVILLTLFLSACSSVPLNESQEKQIQSLAIVSLVPEQVNVMRIGLTVFNNDRATISMEGNIGATIVSAAKAGIAAARPNWKIKDIPVDRNALMQRMNTRGLVMSSSVSKIEKDLGELASQNGVDAILVLSEAKYDSRPVSGVSAVFRAIRTPIGSGAVYADIAASMVNSRGDIIAGANNGRQLNYDWIDVEEYGVNMPLQENLNPGAIGIIRSAVKEVLVQNVDVRLKQLGLSTGK